MKMKTCIMMVFLSLLTACAGSPEKSFVYKIDGVGQVSCNRGAEESGVQQVTSLIGKIAELAKHTSILRGNIKGEEQTDINTLISKVGHMITKLDNAFDDCKKMNDLL